MAIWSPNYAEWVLVQYATARVGAILVTINPAYRSSELEYVLNQSGLSVLVAVESFATSDYRSMIDEVWARVPAERVIYIRTGDWDELMAAAETVSVEQLQQRSSQLAPDDAINIQYTSGTTGFPKGATLSHRNILNNGLFIGEACETVPPRHRRRVPDPGLLGDAGLLERPGAHRRGDRRRRLDAHRGPGGDGR